MVLNSALRLIPEGREDDLVAAVLRKADKKQLHADHPVLRDAILNAMTVVPEDKRGGFLLRVLGRATTDFRTWLPSWMSDPPGLMPMAIKALPDGSHAAFVMAIVDGERARSLKLWTWKMLDVITEALPLMPAAEQSVFLESLWDLEQYNMLQPAATGQNNMVSGATTAAGGYGGGLAARRRQWDAMSGGRRSQKKNSGALLGAVAGMVVGGVLGLTVPPGLLPDIVPPIVAAAALGAAGGAAIVWALMSQSGFDDVMIRVIVNERRSPINPERVTAQAEGWAPKPLMMWRAHEWRYTGGRPYMWLQLPVAERIHDNLRGTLDLLLQRQDLYQAADAAVYRLRSWNRQLSENALDFGQVDAGEDGQEDKLSRYLPWAPPLLEVVGGVALVVITMG